MTYRNSTILGVVVAAGLVISAIAGAATTTSVGKAPKRALLPSLEHATTFSAHGTHGHPGRGSG